MLPRSRTPSRPAVAQTLGLLAAVLALGAALLLALVGFVWYPIRRMRRRRHANHPAQIERNAGTPVIYLVLALALALFVAILKLGRVVERSLGVVATMREPTGVMTSTALSDDEKRFASNATPSPCRARLPFCCSGRFAPSR